jgi:chemotaxis response regulator CheB
MTDLIQMVCLSRSDLVIDVKSRNGRGSIHIRQGQILHAQTELLTGAEAFFEVLRWDDGQFEILPFENNVADSVKKPWEHLLLEAMRLQDERKTECEGNREGSLAKPTPDIISKLDETFSGLNGSAHHSDGPQHGEELTQEASFSSVKVLVVDDSGFFSRRLKGMLELDHAVEVVGIARNGKEALEFLESGVPIDIITLDINMPVMSGDTTLKHIMVRYRTPVVIISSIQPDSMHKVFDFLHLGAVDFLAKPSVDDDLTSYGERLRKLVKALAKSQVSTFKRWRASHDSGSSHVQSVNSTGTKVLIVVGAEGAHIDWLRLPVAQLCGIGPVIGLQKLEDGLARQFAGFIEGSTGFRTEYLSAVHEIAPGNFYLANASRDVRIMARPNERIAVEVSGSTSVGWANGIELWLERLADRVGDSMSVYFLSAAERLSESLLTRLLDRKVRLILSLPQSIVCPQMVEGIKPYAIHFPDLVSFSDPGSLAEVLYRDVSNQDTNR